LPGPSWKTQPALQADLDAWLRSYNERSHQPRRSFGKSKSNRLRLSTSMLPLHRGRPISEILIELMRVIWAERGRFTGGQDRASKAANGKVCYFSAL
jgi:hypothetical protein